MATSRKLSTVVENTGTGHPTRRSEEHELSLDPSALGSVKVSGAAITGYAGAASTAGADLYLQTKDGGASAADASGVRGGHLYGTAGDGAAGGTHTANDPDGGAGGSVLITAGAGGAAGSGGSGAAGAGGLVAARGAFVEKSTQTALTDTATVTAAQLLTKVLDGTPTASATYTLPTAALLVAAMPAAAVGDSFRFLINNKSGGANTITVAGGSGGTADGTLTVAQNVVRSFEVIVTNVTSASEAYFVYGIG